MTYQQYCATCHGPQGKGDGISATGLPIKPQNLTEGALLNPLPDSFLHKVISQGAQAVGLSPLMPAFTPYLSNVQIEEVIAYVRSLAEPASIRTTCCRSRPSARGRCSPSSSAT